MHLPMDLSSATSSVLAAFGLSGSAGLNAWLPLFVSALLARLDVVELAAPLDQLASTTGLVVLGLLMVVDFIGDKVPVIDHVLHLVGTVVAPTSGAALFAAQTADTTDLPTLAAVLLGGATAGAIHIGRSGLRAASTATTAGVGSPALSTAEDASSGALTALAFVAPVVAFAAVAALAVAIVLGIRRLSASIRAPRGR
jgi:hypothetical protein